MQRFYQGRPVLRTKIVPGSDGREILVKLKNAEDGADPVWLQLELAEYQKHLSVEGANDVQGHESNSIRSEVQSVE